MRPANPYGCSCRGARPGNPARPSIPPGTGGGGPFAGPPALHAGCAPRRRGAQLWAYGLHNGAFAFDEAAYRWLNCVVLTTSTGNVTSSRRQVELAISSRATAIMTTGDYLLRLVDAAKEMGYDPRTDFTLRAIPNIGDRALLERTFGLEYFATYGFHEVQTVAIECSAHDGLHIFEDAFVVQVVDPVTGEPQPDGQLGSLCITELYKTGARSSATTSMTCRRSIPPASAPAAAGSAHQRVRGRGDTMIKLRGVNVWPEAVGTSPPPFRAPPTTSS